MVQIRPVLYLPYLFYLLLFAVLQIDLVHIHAVPESDHVEQGIDLTEYYINVEWDILRNVSQSVQNTVLIHGMTVMWVKNYC
jgi:hypothetical protein